MITSVLNIRTIDSAQPCLRWRQRFTFKNRLVLLFLQDQPFIFFRVDVTGKGQGDYLVGKIVFAGSLLVLFQKSDLFMTEVTLGQWVGVISLL